MTDKVIRKIGILTSGGDAPGMNAAIRAVVRSCVYNGVACVGILQGYKGLLENDFIDLDAFSVCNIISRGGSFLRSARCPEFKDPAARRQAFENARAKGIDALVVIGGDGSFTGALKLQQETGLSVIGIPGTIDNDIYGTDYTIGFDTAINTAMDAIDKIRDTAAAHDRIFFVEVMGHGSGFIAVYTGVATGCENIIMPPLVGEGGKAVKDNAETLKMVIDNLKYNPKRSSLIIVSENGNHIGERVSDIAAIARESLPGRDIKETVLGHIQRGGSPSCADRVLATRLGVGAVEGLLCGEINKVVGVRDNKVVYTQFRDNTAKYEHSAHNHPVIGELRDIALKMNA